MVEIVSVPFDLCGPHHGSRLGSMAMQLQGLRSVLADLGQETTVVDVLQVSSEPPGPRSECDAEAIKVVNSTRKAVASSLANSKTPLVIGGDHSISIGSISGALDVFGEGLAVVWIDAHMDFNTPDTTPTGNLHGMSLGALAKLLPAVGIDQLSVDKVGWAKSVFDLWPELLAHVPDPGLNPSKMAWIGLRDVDPGEVQNLERTGGSFTKTMQDVDGEGILGCMASLDDWLCQRGVSALWVSFDVDVLDPVFAPGTGTAVRGGLTYREGHLVAETLAKRCNDPSSPYRLAGVDVVEVNPLRDHDNETAKIAVEWVSSLFGRTIMNHKGSR